ncbi:MAG: 3'(2'),5'-bisphosphate nucleotidase CysQ [Pseudomonadota bacterium]
MNKRIYELAEQAGDLIMTYYKTGTEVEQKSDKSPVTEADKAADRLISARLNEIAPEIMIVSEEGEKPNTGAEQYFWLVDPLDGTKSFIRGNGYFTVNIALIKDKKPSIGVIYNPLDKVMYWGAEGQAFRRQNDLTTPIKVRSYEKSDIAAFISHSHINLATEDYLSARNITNRIPCASSIKLCFLAEGKADLYPRFGTTMEWDIAAGHAILEAAGGKIITPQDDDFLYAKQDFINGNFIAYGDQNAIQA